MKLAIVNAHLSSNVGGSEVQCDIIATELAARGHEVHYIAVGGGGRSDLYAIHSVGFSARQVGEKCLEIDPDIVYWRFNKRLLFGAARIISHGRIPIVFSVSHINDVKKWASKTDLSATRLKDTTRILRERLLSRWNYVGFRYVRGVVVNNADHLGLIPVERQLHIDNSVKMHRGHANGPAPWPRPYCLWVANLKPQKQPEKFLQLAERLSNSGVDFLMAGHIQSKNYRYIERRQLWPENFFYLGPQSSERVTDLVRGSLFVVHTCLPEGFPNIFIQAWCAGKAVVSLSFDPEGLLERSQIGLHSRNFEQFVNDVERLIRDDALRARMGRHGKAIASVKFESTLNAEKLESFLEQFIP